MNPLTKQTRVFTLIGIITSIIGYLFLMYKGFDLNEEIAKKRKEINQLEELRLEKSMQLREIESRLLEITSNSRDSLTVQQGEELAEELGIPTGKHFKVTSVEETSLENAQEFEKMGFEYLLERNVDKSIEFFIKSENSYNSYHQVYEIGRFLIKNKSKLTDNKSNYWLQTYQTILSEYSWKMPEKYREALEEQLKQNVTQQTLK
jgi:hypothetical protein